MENKQHLIVNKDCTILSYKHKIWKIIKKIIDKPEKFYENFYNVDFINQTDNSCERIITFNSDIIIKEDIIADNFILKISKNGIKNCPYFSALILLTVETLDDTHCKLEINADYCLSINLSIKEFDNKANETILNLLYTIKTFAENMCSS